MRKHLTGASTDGQNVSDVMMPRLDGFGLLPKLRAEPRTAAVPVVLLPKLRAEPRTAAVPVVLLSARAGEEAKVEGLDAGADDYLVKPFSGKELLARVRATLETARLRQDAARRDQQERSLKEEAARKDAFIAMLAHELRNPLGPIRNAVQLLGTHRDAATADRVRQMIERVDLAQLAFLIAGDEAAAFETAGVRIEVTVSEIPVWVSGDRTRLTQVVSNLLDNALKFTDRGGKVTVTVRGDGAEAVWYLYKDTRSGEFLKELLAGYSGVLVSDFYNAYDGINCPQQKCLLHLLRDVNDDLKKNPFDEEFKLIASQFGVVLRSIIDTIDKYGLKRWRLRKHKSEAQAFLSGVDARTF